VKPLSNYLKNCQCFTASTIMGDGRVAMILDVAGIAGFAKLSFNEANAERARRGADLNQDKDLSRHDVILFTYGQEDVFAIPLSSVLRLEKFNPKQIQRVGSQEFLTYRGKGLPLVRLEQHLSVQPFPPDLEEAYLIIPKNEQCEVGLIASQILDALSLEVKLQPVFRSQPGIRGAAIIQEKMTVFIDPDALLAQAGVGLDEKAAAYA
jgi:two-component system chemotaxis sensor kinase CheA